MVLKMIYFLLWYYLKNMAEKSVSESMVSIIFIVVIFLEQIEQIKEKEFTSN